jgi:hypothetical protein
MPLPLPEQTNMKPPGPLFCRDIVKASRKAPTPKVMTFGLTAAIQHHWAVLNLNHSMASIWILGTPESIGLPSRFSFATNLAAKVTPLGLWLNAAEQQSQSLFQRQCNWGIYIYIHTHTHVCMYVMLSYVTYDRNLVIRICRYNYIYMLFCYIFI